MLNSGRTYESSESTQNQDYSEYLADKNIQKPVLDNFDLVSIVFLGIGCVVIINAVFTDLAFFIDNMPNAGLAFVIPLVLNVPQVIGQLFAIKYLSKLPLKITVIVITVAAAVISAAIPGFVLTNAKLTLTLSAMCYFGVYMAIINSVVVGYISSIQEKRAMSMFMFGSGINSLVILLVQIVCMTSLSSQMVVQSFLYFGITAVLFLVTCYSFVRLTRKYEVHESKEIKWQAIKMVYSEIWPEAISISLVYGVSLAVYPGLLLQMSWWGYSGSVMSVSVVGFYNIFDCIGRFIPTYVQSPSKTTLRLLSAARLLFIVTVVLAMPVGVAYLQTANWYSVVNTLLIAVSNGYVGTFVMISGCSSTAESEVAGYIMAFHLTLGLALGSIVAVLLSLVVL